MIEIKGICKKYNNTLFDQADAVINSGQKTYIRGINGSGKSVLLKMMVGYYKPDSGEIVADGYTVGKDGDFLRDAGISINAPQFVPGLTGMEIFLNLRQSEKRQGKMQKTLAFSLPICYIYSAIRTEADLLHVARRAWRKG